MRLLLFDIDGTLITTGGAGRGSMNFAFEQVIGVSDVLSGENLGGRTDQDIAQKVLSRHLKDLTPSRLTSVREEVFGVYAKRLPEVLASGTTDYVILPAVIETLEWLLPRNIRLGLATGNISKGAALKLGHRDLMRYFEIGGYGDDALERYLILEAAWSRAKALDNGPEDPAEVLVIGDTVRDITAARQAGMKVAAVATGNYSYEELEAEKPDYLWKDLHEGLAWMKEVQIGAS